MLMARGIGHKEFEMPEEEMGIPGRDDVRTLPLKVSDLLYCNEGMVLRIVKMLNKSGMRGTVYFARRDEDEEGKELFVAKIPFLDENQTEKKLDGRILALRADMLNEINAWERLQKSDKAGEMFARVVGSGNFKIQLKGKIRLLEFVIQEYIQGNSLSDWCISNFGVPSSDGTGHRFTGITNAGIWFEVAQDLVSVVKASHDQRVIHGDLWPPNIMMRLVDSEDGTKAKPVLIDFGRAWLLDHEFDHRGEDNTRFPFYAPELWFKEKKTWYAPADIYSLGGVLYYLATGIDPPSPYRGNLDPIILNSLTEKELKARTKSNTELKQEIVSKMIQTNLSLYSKNPGVADIIHYCLRTRVDERAQHANAVLEVVDLFRNAFQQNHSASLDDMTDTEMPDQSTIVDGLSGSLKSIENPLFRSLVEQRIKELKTQLKSATTRLFNITGDRESVVNALLTSLSCLKKGDQCLGLTTPIFWRRRNFGSNGRFLTMLKLAALNGISVRWVILVNKNDLKDEAVRVIMQAQCNAILELANNIYRMAGHPHVRTNDKSLNGPGFYVGWLLQQDENYEIYLRQAKTFICLNRKVNGADHSTLFAPAYSERSGGLISIVRCWADSPRWDEELKGLFNSALDSSTNVCQYHGVTPDVSDYLG